MFGQNKRNTLMKQLGDTLKKELKDIAKMAPGNRWLALDSFQKNLSERYDEAPTTKKIFNPLSVLPAVLLLAAAALPIALIGGLPGILAGVATLFCGAAISVACPSWDVKMFRKVDDNRNEKKLDQLDSKLTAQIKQMKLDTMKNADLYEMEGTIFSQTSDRSLQKEFEAAAKKADPSFDALNVEYMIWDRHGRKPGEHPKLKI